MPECEICGRKTETAYEIELDGDQLLVCERCTRGKKVIGTFEPEKRAQKAAAAAPDEAREGPEEIIEGYGEQIRRARDALRLSMAVLSEKINEKESMLARIEKEKALPSEKTRLKLEKELGIRLTAKTPGSKSFTPRNKNEAVTLWDLAKKEEDGE